MSDSGEEADVEGTDPVESLIERQRQEKKQLQSTIYNLRKTCPRKEKGSLQERISTLETELKAKHEREMGQLQTTLSGSLSLGGSMGSTDKANSQSSGNTSPDISNYKSGHNLNVSEYVGDDEGEDGDLESGVATLRGTAHSASTGTGQPPLPATQKKKGKALKRREKAEKAHQERLEKQKHQSEAVDKSNKVAQAEMSQLVSLLADRNLRLVQVPADGDCFYHAINRHLKAESETKNGLSKIPTIADLRCAVSDFLLVNKDEYSGFFDPADNNSEAATFAEYCDKIKSNNEWAGHMEITAMSRHLNRPIEIIQASTNPMVIGSDLQNGADLAKPSIITLVYHRHMFNCGEHYNLALPAENEC